MADWDIHGFAIAIKKDEHLIVIKGFGIKILEAKEPVDGYTLFVSAIDIKL